MPPRKDPFRNFRFRVEIDGIQQAAFSEATGIESTVEPIDYRVGSDPTHVRKLPGMTKYSPITLNFVPGTTRATFQHSQFFNASSSLQTEVNGQLRMGTKSKALTTTSGLVFCRSWCRHSKPSRPWMFPRVTTTRSWAGQAALSPTLS
jgi:phage tail-like protein